MGAVCALCLVLLPAVVTLPDLTPMQALPVAYLFPAIILVAVIGRIAQRRFFDEDLIDGDRPAPHTAAEIDQRVLTNTAEQALIAALVWPFVAMVQGGAAVIVLGAGFAVFRTIFWLGYHAAPPFRSMGFAGTFYATVLALIWSGLSWAARTF